MDRLQLSNCWHPMEKSVPCLNAAPRILLIFCFDRCCRTSDFAVGQFRPLLPHLGILLWVYSDPCCRTSYFADGLFPCCALLLDPLSLSSRIHNAHKEHRSSSQVHSAIRRLSASLPWIRTDRQDADSRRIAGGRNCDSIDGINGSCASVSCAVCSLPKRK